MMRLLLALMVLGTVGLVAYAQEQESAVLELGQVLDHPKFEAPQVVEGKRDAAEKERLRLEKLKQKRERQEYNREHPGPIRSFFSSAFSFVFAPVLAGIQLLKALPFIVWGFVLLVAALLVSWIYRAVAK